MITNDMGQPQGFRFEESGEKRNLKTDNQRKRRLAHIRTNLIICVLFYADNINCVVKGETSFLWIGENCF